MSKDSTIHCNTSIFSTFEHCPDCGDKIKNKPILSSVEKIKPDIIDPIKPYFKNARVFTGIVLKTHLYTRSKVLEHGSLKHSTTEIFERAFNFVSIENEHGEVLSINLDGSESAASLIKIGDTLTVFEPEALNISMPAPKGIKSLINDRLADAFVIHNMGGSSTYKENASELFNPCTPSLVSAIGTGIYYFIIVALISFMLGLVGLNIPEIVNTIPQIASEQAMNIVWILAGLAGFFGVCINFKTAKTKSATYQAYKQVIKDILPITNEQLGYQQHSPKNSDDDVFCPQCDTRISKQFQHCSHCGTQQIISQNRSNTDQSLTAKLTTPTQTNSIKDKRLELMEKYQYDSAEQPFIYRKFLGLTEHFSCSSEARVYRVLDRSLYTEEKTSSNSSVRYTETRGITGNHISTNIDSSHTTHRTRVHIEGKVLAENHKGEIIEIELHPEILGTLDTGDYIFLAYQWIKKRKCKEKAYRMVAANLTKKIHVTPYDIRDYSSESIIGKILPFSAVVAGVFAGINFDTFNAYLFQMLELRIPPLPFSFEYWGLGLTSFFISLYLLVSITNIPERGNSKRAWKLVKPVFDLKSQMYKDGAVEQLDKYK